MNTLFTIGIALLCIVLTAVILIQNPKGGGVNTSLNTEQLFSVNKSTKWIENITWGLASAIFLLCIITVS